MTNDIYGVLNDMRNYAILNHVPIISQDGADLLINLVKIHKPCNILEIGTAIGYSSLLMAAHQPPGSKLISIEKDIEAANIARQFIKTANIRNQIELIEGDAGDIIPSINLEGYFDLVFIDAAKGQYLDYLHKVLDKLSLQAIVVADNVLFRGFIKLDLTSDVIIPRRFRTIVKRLRAYLDFVRGDPRFKTEIFQYGDGLAVSYYKGDNIYGR